VQDIELPLFFITYSLLGDLASQTFLSPLCLFSYLLLYWFVAIYFDFFCTNWGLNPFYNTTENNHMVAKDLIVNWSIPFSYLCWATFIITKYQRNSSFSIQVHKNEKWPIPPLRHACLSVVLVKFRVSILDSLRGSLCEWLNGFYVWIVLGLQQNRGRCLKEACDSETPMKKCAHGFFPNSPRWGFGFCSYSFWSPHHLHQPHDVTIKRHNYFQMHVPIEYFWSSSASLYFSLSKYMFECNIYLFSKCMF
jgi:hypothetical protein